MSKKFVLLYSLVGVGLGVILPSLSVLGWMLFGPIGKIIEINSPIPLENTQLKKGDTISMIVDYCRYTDAPVITRATLVGEDYIHTYPSTETRFPAGCDRVVNSSRAVPLDAPPIPLVLHLNLDYEINPLRHYRVTFVTEEFQVVE